MSDDVLYRFRGFDDERHLNILREPALWLSHPRGFEDPRDRAANVYIEADPTNADTVDLLANAWEGIDLKHSSLEQQREQAVETLSEYESPYILLPGTEFRQRATVGIC